MCCYYSVFLECFLSIIFWTFPPAHPSFDTHSCISFILAVHCCVSNLFAVEDSAELLCLKSVAEKDSAELQTASVLNI
jgi:hypothetical protein